MAKSSGPSHLPKERISSPSLRRLLVVLVLVLVVVGVNQGARHYLRYNGTNLGYRMVTAKYDLLDRLAEGEPADWLILGDSSGAHGIVPEDWSSTLGGTTHNLAIVADLLAVNDAWMLGEYLSRVGVPKNVVLVHAHDVWHRGYNSALIGQIPRPWGFWSRRSPSVSLSYTHLRKVALSRFLPLFSESASLQAHIRHLGPDRDLNFAMDRGGWIPGQPHSSDRLRNDAQRTETFIKDNPQFKLSSHNKRALRVLGRYADRQGFNVYVTHAPMLDKIARTSRFRRYTDAADSRIVSQTNAYQNIYAVPDVVSFPFEKLEAYVDHVTPEAAPEYTRRLAKIVDSYRTENGLVGPLPSVRTDFVPPSGIAFERPSDDDTVSLLFGGDTSFARGIDSTIQRYDGNSAAVFEQLKPLFDTVDLTFLNLECVLSDSSAQQAKKRWKIRAPTQHATALARAGVDLVSVANNHTLDFGNQGFSTTLDTLETVGVDYVGVQYGDAPRQPVTIAKLGDQTFGFLAYTDISKWKSVDDDHWQYYWPKPANYRVDAIVADIEAANSQVDHLVISVHWGDEYSMLVEDDQREAAHRFIDAGAELIIGHHPHVPRIIETYKDGLIAYSLGDLLFDKTTPFKTVRNRRRYMLQLDYTAGKRSAVTLHPIHSLDDHIPYPKPDLEVDSWRAAPIETPWRAVDHLDSAVVTRFDGQTAAVCDRWKTGSPEYRDNGYLQWLRPRWSCAGDNDRTWLTVAVSGDRSDEVFKRAIWAHPHKEGPLTLTFDDVPLGSTLGGLGGVPDWPLLLAGSQTSVPIVLRVSIDGEWVQRVEVPYESGWVPFTIDTLRWAGTTATVEVSVEGGSTRETGFTFDLMVDAQP